MFKIIIATFFAFCMSLTAVHAGPSKAIFRGNYDGYSLIEDVRGNRVFYSPVRFKISKNGVITGTAFHDDTDKLLKVRGKISKVKVMFGIRYLGTASGTFSDGTKWKVEIEANKGIPDKIIRGNAWRGRFSGEIGLTN